VSLVDPAVAVARELHRRMKAGELLSSRRRVGTERFWTSGAPDQVEPVIARLWGKDVEVCPLPPAFTPAALAGKPDG